MPSARIMTVIRVVSTRGKGSDDDPCREVIDFFTEDGARLAGRDLFLAEEVRRTIGKGSSDPGLMVTIPLKLLQELARLIE